MQSRKCTQANENQLSKFGCTLEYIQYDICNIYECTHTLLWTITILSNFRIAQESGTTTLVCFENNDVFPNQTNCKS